MSERDIRCKITSKMFSCRDCGQDVHFGRRMLGERKLGTQSLCNPDGSLHYLTCPNHKPKQQQHPTCAKVDAVQATCRACGKVNDTLLRYFQRAAQPQCEFCGGGLELNQAAEHVLVMVASSVDESKKAKGGHTTPRNKRRNGTKGGY